MMIIPLLLSICACLNALAAASRQAWALGRDQVLPFSPWFRKVCMSCNSQSIVDFAADTDLDRRHRNPRPHQQYLLLPLSLGHHRVDQHRLDRCTQHHRRPAHWRHKLQLRAEHRLHPVQTLTRRASPACSLLTWEIGACDQCVCDLLRDCLGDGFVLPCYGSNECGEHELVLGDVWGSGCNCLR